MALYLGNSGKLQIVVNGISYDLNQHLTLPNIDEVILSSSDDCILKDYDGLYLTMKEV